ncbi:hypothetical protein [Arthrobacter sp. 2MCAF14]|uniref:hypothetical protein n=1 Tax=Arthrobacter sp. 2MCAF14 TaxID=3232982 RepID=UPI003F922C80
MNSSPVIASFSLAELPERATLHSVTAAPVEIAGRTALRVELTDAVTLTGTPGVDYIDMPTFVAIPADFTNGIIEVDILSRLNGKGPADARAFAGVAYRIADPIVSFEAVYLRPLNGRKTNPSSPRDQRAAQYFANPCWNFENLREQYPDGRYEAGADIGPDEWMSLKLDIDGTKVVAYVNDEETLTVTETLAAPFGGSLGLFVDIGTEAFFSRLTVISR